MEKPAPTIRDLYPTLTAEELREAEDNVGQYIALALRVYERVASDPALYAQLRALLAKNRTVQSSTRGGGRSAMPAKLVSCGNVLLLPR